MPQTKPAKKKRTTKTYFKCIQCRGYFPVKRKRTHQCVAPTVEGLVEGLEDDAWEAWTELRQAAEALGPHRIYASAKAIMFSRRICYLFVRPKPAGLELCLFLNRSVKHPLIKRVQPYTKTKYAHTLLLVHRDQVEEPLTDWLGDAYRLAE